MQNSKAALAIPTLSPLETRIVKLMVVLFVVFSLLPYGISWDYRGTSDLTMEGSLTTKLQWGGLFLFSAIILFRHLQTVLDDLRAMNPFLILILLWCLISSIWSPLPAVTFKRAVQLYGLVMLALCVNLAQNPLRLLLNYLLYTLNAILVLSFFMAIAIPSIGIDYELGGAWRGALSQKNELGQAAAMAILLWQVKACDEKLGLRMLFAGIVFSALMLVMSRSSTSMSITLITSIIFHLLRKRRLNSPYSMTRIFLAINCVVLVMLFVFFMYESRMPTWSEISSPVAHIFGKNSDLTGRTDIWELVWMEVQKHWLFGLGYGAFWLGPDSLSQFVIDALNWIPLQSHNGYLDILNEQGIVGLCLTVLLLFTQARKLAILARLDRHQAAFWTAMLVVVIITNLTESSLFRGFGFQNVFFIFALIAVTSSTRRLKVMASHEL